MKARPGGFRGRVMALDVGDKRVGIAISDPTRTLSRPLDTVPQHPRPRHFAALRDIIEKHEISLVVVGYPIALDGSAGAQARRTERYQRALAAALGVPVVLWDERYSTSIAMDLLRDAGSAPDGRGGLDSRGMLDAAAAAVILQSYLDSRAAETIVVPGARGGTDRDHQPEGDDETTA